MGTATKSQFKLFYSRNFMPLFLTQFLGAFNDNFFKSAMIILITYRLADHSGVNARILVTIAAGIFILPFFLCSSLAGQLADKYDRASVARATKLAEIVVMIGAVVGFYMGSISILMVVLFLMGAQSAFFSPIKYSILPQHLAEDELIGANALIEMGTFLSILTGTIFGGLFIMHDMGLHLVSVLVISIAALGYLTSRYIPPTVPVNPNLRFRFNPISETVVLIRDLVGWRDILFPVLGIAWFWLVGATFLSQFPAYAKEVIGADEQVATLFLATFSVGIGIGSLACNSLLKNEISGRYVPASAMGMSIAGVLLYFASRRPDVVPGTMIGVTEFLSAPVNLVVLLCLCAISFCGGLYIVPLYAIIQARSGAQRLARVTVCTNIMDSLFMVISSVGTTILLTMGVDIPGVFLVLAVLTAVSAVIMRGVVNDAERAGIDSPKNRG